MDKNMRNNTYALVFSGGGARGAYEMGVWRALDELNIDVQAVAGTSIGSINGALFAQGDFGKALSAWNDLTPDMIFDSDLIGIKKYRSIDKIRELLTQYIDEKAVRNSKINFVLVTFNLSDLKDETLFIEDIPDGKLIDYILASANYPVFERQKIDGKYYIDGGLYNNLPAKPLAEKGYKHLLLVDVRDPFAKTYRKFDTKGYDITIIKPKHSLPNVLHFDQDVIRENLIFGYYDTLQIFGKYLSSYYYITDSENDVVDYNFTNEDIVQLNNDDIFNELFKNDNAMENILAYVNEFRESSSSISFKSKDFFVSCLEICADILGIERSKEYTLNEMYDILLHEFIDIREKGMYLEESIKERVEEKIKNKELSFEQDDKKILFATMLAYSDKIAYFYEIFIRIAPKISISYLTASIMLNRNEKSEITY